MNYDILPLFSTPIYSSIDDYRPSKEEVETIISLNSDEDFSWQTNKTNSFLSQEKYVLNNMLLSNIKTLCMKHLEKYSKNVLCLKQNLYITNSWVSIKKPGQDHHVHKHPNSILSGVYYASIADDYLNFCGDPGFLKDYNFSYSYEDWNVYNSSRWRLPVTTGSIVIFPSCTLHGVSVNNSNEDRIIIGFNTFVSGKFGENAYCSDLNL